MIDQIFLELPYPISTNRYWRIFRGDSVVSADTKAYKNTIKNIAAEKNIVPFNGNVSLQIIIYRSIKLIQIYSNILKHIHLKI